MKKFFLPIAFVSMLSIFACHVTHKAPGSNNQVNTKQEQMYAGHTMLKPEEVPAPALSAWNREHSGVSGAEWYKEDSGYVVYYLSKKLQSRILYNDKGNVIMQSREVEVDDVPVAIREFMKTKYPGIQYGRTFLSSEMGGENKKYYEVQVDNNTWERFELSGNNIGKK